ncbi:hypothetical protein ACFYT4_05105 [Streptomyces sp. NPDC004609]|uniref:hypothetical protein n=1 Tax=Streptomyces sp. NPDC004609 TaxID=3364704 RepID=UPI0036AA5842
MVNLSAVFGISANANSKSYVDRGGLDARFRQALAADRHIAVHGGSKQGKTWLRTKGLEGEATIVVQCTPGATASSLLQEALGRIGVQAVLKMTNSRDLEGSLDFSGSGELGAKILAKLSLTGKLGAKAKIQQGKELQPIGQTAADLAWVAETIAASDHRLVLEDFHYIDETVQRELAFMLKAMGEYGLFVVIVGVWPKTHLLSYYNGDLEGRVDDIHLTWSDAELTRVLVQGADALKITFSAALIAELVREASGNVGLLQRLAEQVCTAEQVYSSPGFGGARRNLDVGASLAVARQAVADQMEGRFETFADNFVRGMRRLPQGLEVYRHLLEAVTDASDQELLDGIDSAVLLQRIASHPGGAAIRASDLTQALDRIDSLQLKIGVQPLVLTYNKSSRKLFLADRSFLFFRRHGNPIWPWAAGAPDITNDLAQSDPLDF